MARHLSIVLPLLCSFVLAASNAQASLNVMLFTVPLRKTSNISTGCESAVPCGGIAAGDCGHRRIHGRHGHVRCPQGLDYPFNVAYAVLIWKLQNQNGVVRGLAVICII